MSSKRSNTAQSNAHLVQALNHVSNSGFKFQMANDDLITSLSKDIKGGVQLQLCVTLDAENEPNATTLQLLERPAVIAVSLKNFGLAPWQCGAKYEPAVLVSHLHSGVKKLSMCDTVSTQCSRSCCSLEYPTDLNTLELHNVRNMKAPLPPSLETLSITNRERGCLYPQLLEGLSKLTIYDTDTTTEIEEMVFPTSLQQLDLIVHRIGHIHLPVGLVKYTLGSKTRSTLPASLQVLDLSQMYINHPPLELPPALQCLWLGNMQYHPVTNLPSSLRMLNLSHCFRSDIDVLPDGLEVLVFEGLYFNKKLPELPQSLLKLVLPVDYSYDIKLPESLRELVIQKSNLAEWTDFDRSRVVCHGKGLKISYRGSLRVVYRVKG